MRLATIIGADGPAVAIVDGDRVLPLAMDGVDAASMRAIAGAGEATLRRIGEWAHHQPDEAYRPLEGVELGPAVPDPSAIYTVGLNYRDPSDLDDPGPERPLIYGKAASSVAGQRATIAWDRSLTSNVDAECELGIVIGAAAHNISVDEALECVFGYTIINDVSSRDPWLDGDQWLIGKSMPAFCPVGPWIVTRDELDASDLRLGCTINDVPIQDGRTSQMRFGMAEVVSYLSRHLELRPGDLIASGTPARLEGEYGPDRHLERGDVVTVWIDGIGELTSIIG